MPRANINSVISDEAHIFDGMMTKYMIVAQGSSMGVAFR